MSGSQNTRKHELTRLRVARFREGKRRKTDSGAVSATQQFVHGPSTSSAMEGFHEQYQWKQHTVSDNSITSDSGNSGDDNIQERTDHCEIYDKGESEAAEPDEGNDETNVGRKVEEEESEEEGEENDDDDYDEINELRIWAQNSKIPLTQLDSLLGILRKRLLPTLPKSAKTLLKTTSVEYEIRKLDGGNNKDGGEFVYFGIEQNLQRTINIDLHEESVLHLLINIDGLPLYKSSSKQFWPILCKVYFEPDIYKPFVVAIYAGNQKHQNLQQFLDDFIREINQLAQTGMVIDDKLFHIRIKSFICDRPARSFIKCIIGHGGYYACERCTVRGERVKNRTIYPHIDCEQRSDESFRRQTNSEHHNDMSPLVDIDPAIDMVTQFSLDFMHLCCLGVMKKMLTDFWLNSKMTTQLSQSNKQFLSNNLTLLQSQIPEEFQRTTRSLNDIAKWKATEFRFFLLYSGPILLKKVLSEQQFKHFLLFHAACRILCSAELACNKHAKQFLQNFFILAGHLYGRHSQIMNMHSLIHLADDVENMGCSLTNLTTFPFENMLGKLKKTIRSGNRLLAQVCRRLHERFETENQKAILPPKIKIVKKGRGNENLSTPITKLQYKDFLISTKPPNNTVLLCNGSILQIFYIRQAPNTDLILKGIVLRVIKSIFTYPCDSADFKMWQVKRTQSIKTCSLKSIDRKMATLDISNETEEKLYVISLLH